MALHGGGIPRKSYLLMRLPACWLMHRATLLGQRDAVLRSRLWARPQAMVIAAAVVLAVAYLVATPRVPDLAAQVARAQVARGGVFIFWTGWFGGVNLPSYSAIAPIVMSVIGVGVTAALSALTATVAARWLLRGSRRPGLGLAFFAVDAFVDIYSGRVTFALGVAFAIVALSLLKARRGRWACAVGAVACLASPLAGLFLGLVAISVAAADRSRRTTSVVLAAILAVVGIVLGLLSPGTGRMPYPWWHLVLGVLTVAVVAVICPQRLIRWGCVVVGLATVGFYFVPLAVGTNIVRFDWLVAAPVVVAYAELSRIRLVAVVAAALAWPLADFGVQLAYAGTPAASPAFYQPLISELHTQAATVSQAGDGERVEVVDSASQWSADYVAPSFALARGWDRQVDRADNPLFYNGTLTATSYHHWLSGLAVGWVALPLHTSLDYAAVDEAALIRSQPHYLRLVWQNPNWQLYRVRAAKPLVRGATPTAVGSAGVSFHAAAAGPVQLQLRWSPYLTLAVDKKVIPACIKARGPWTTVWIPHPGTFTVAAHLEIDRQSATQTCPSH
jgi:hypothetical protein